MASSSAQHRCVFVGNIPYDATEEQLVQICEEVGPVVSFRLVLDRDTGKPKGYGFCEYKDEETALSARRNLQGYEINNRQLRVDFAANDKGTDKNGDQGRGGPGLSNADGQKAQRVSPLPSNTLQPIGFPSAVKAASVMDRALGVIQPSNVPNLQEQSGFTNDPLTDHLSKMSRNQLLEVINETKTLLAQDKKLVRELLEDCPQLMKALFQALVMLGLVPENMMQKLHNHQPVIASSHPQPEDIRVSIPPQLTGKYRSQLPQDAQSYHTAAPLGKSGDSKSGNKSGVQTTAQPHPSSFNNYSEAQTLPLSNQNVAPSYRANFSSHKASAEVDSSVSRGYASIHNDGTCMLSDSGTKCLRRVTMADNVIELGHRPSKIAKMENGNSPTTSGFTSGMGFTEQSAMTHAQHPQIKTQLPEAEAALLQQVMNLTSEQLNSLPLDQRQQVIRLQQMLGS